MCECSCWVKYPNPMHKNKNGKWKCVDDYECVQDLEVVETPIGITAVRRKTHCKRKEINEMVSINDFQGEFKKQLAYYNRTFLVGYYKFTSGPERFEVIREGRVYKCNTLGEAVEKFNEISKIPK